MHCQDCERAEVAEQHRLAPLWFACIDWWDRRRNPPSIFGGYGATFRAAIGIREPTHYDRHRAEFVRTGDMRELARMTRQVR